MWVCPGPTQSGRGLVLNSLRVCVSAMNRFRVEFNGNQDAPHVISAEDRPGKGADPESQDSSEMGHRMAPWSVQSGTRAELECQRCCFLAM